MAEVVNMPLDSLDQRDGNDKSAEEQAPSQSPSPPPPPPASRRRRDDREVDRPPNRRPDFYDRNRSSPPRERDRDRDYKRRSSPSPPPPYRDRRHSPPRRSPPFPPYKRSRRDDAAYDGRRGSPRGGFGPGDRRYEPYYLLFCLHFVSLGHVWLQWTIWKRGDEAKLFRVLVFSGTWKSPVIIDYIIFMFVFYVTIWCDWETVIRLNLNPVIVPSFLGNPTICKITDSSVVFFFIWLLNFY